MGMMIGTKNPGIIKIEMRNRDGSYAGTMSISKPRRKQTGQKKRLRYNFKAISTQFMRAKTSGNVGQVIVKARGKIVDLRRKLKSSEYNESEVTSAILHAEKMLRIAKKRKKHLQEEERAQQKGGVDFSAMEEEQMDMTDVLSKEDLETKDEDVRQRIKELLKQMEEMMAELERENELNDLAEELSQNTQGKMTPDELEQLKKKHRAEELREIIKADMEYLKALFERFAREKQAAAQSSISSNRSNQGVSLQLNGVEMPVETAEAPVMAEGAVVDELA